MTRSKTSRAECARRGMIPDVRRESDKRCRNAHGVVHPLPTTGRTSPNPAGPACRRSSDPEWHKHEGRGGATLQQVQDAAKVAGGVWNEGVISLQQNGNDSLLFHHLAQMAGRTGMNNDGDGLGRRGTRRRQDARQSQRSGFVFVAGLRTGFNLRCFLIRGTYG
jgi:hypothetical protein